LSRQFHNRDRLLSRLRRDYVARSPRSQAGQLRAGKVLVDGISHGARSFDPYPFRISAAQGARVTDLDGHEIIDFWQGHYTNVLGHNPAVIREKLCAELECGAGLQTGLPDERESEFAELLAHAVGAERVRLTTAGTLATMYAIMLARAFTGRTLVLKVSGGWHGANPLALKGVDRTECGFDQVDSAGVPLSTADEILVTRFNDVERLQRVFEQYGDRIACFIFEPCMGGAGFVPATAEFMMAARDLTAHYGALLILDEIITGFRYCAAGVQRLYGVQPDLSTFGKVIGGGMPLVAVTGRAAVMDLAGSRARNRVWFNGGTFSSHPLSLLAGKTMIEYLQQHQDEVYPLLAMKGEQLRTGVERVFAARGILARSTGCNGGTIKGSSLLSIYFPLNADQSMTAAEDFLDPHLSDVVLREQVLKLGLLLHDVNTVHGLGAISTSHSDRDLERVYEACDDFARCLLVEG
jgi:glutamate-1-semialdehyde 2,1-aminomutase